MAPLAFGFEIPEHKMTQLVGWLSKLPTLQTEGSCSWLAYEGSMDQFSKLSLNRNFLQILVDPAYDGGSGTIFTINASLLSLSKKNVNELQDYGQDSLNSTPRFNKISFRNSLPPLPLSKVNVIWCTVA